MTEKLLSLAAEDFLHQLRRVNTERYDAWAQQPLMECEFCGRSANNARSAGSTHCNAPFDIREHAFTKPHPYLTASNDAGIMFDALELGGEVGELLNVVKKLEREDRGWRGSRAESGAFADECADVLICLDKLARRQGVDLIAATVAKFNATSEKVALPQRLAFAEQSRIPDPSVAVLREALNTALDHYERGICHHDETSRGGVGWTICDQCDAKWADSEGGFVPFAYPPEIERAFSVLAALSSTNPTLSHGERG